MFQNERCNQMFEICGGREEVSGVTISKEKMNYTIDLLITMVTDEIAEETGKDRKEILTDFLCSKTGKALYDEKTKLWCNGPAYIAELYREELKKSGYQI